MNMNYIKEICKIGQGAACCRYLTMGGNGFECAKLTPMKLAIDLRADTMNAQGDNCEGVITAQIIQEVLK